MTARYPLRARRQLLAPRKLERGLERWANNIEALTEGPRAGQIRRAPVHKVEVFTVVTEFDDWVLCERARTEGQVAVAKPEVLRGATASRTDNGEDQVIVPGYAGELLAIYVPAGVVGIAAGGGVVTPVYWADLNNAGRMWAKEFGS